MAEKTKKVNFEMVDMISELVMRKSLENSKLKAEVDDLKQQMREREDQSDQLLVKSINYYKEQLSDSEKKYEKLEGEKRDIVRDKERLKHLLTKTTNELRDSKNKMNKILGDLTTLKADIKEKYISKDDHKQAIFDSEEFIKSLQTEIQLFRNEFVSNITAFNADDTTNFQ